MRRVALTQGLARLRLRRVSVWVWVFVACCLTVPRLEAVQGLPLTRFYPFEEIGAVSRGARLSFDALGRVVVIQEDQYVVLNDDTWVQLAGNEFGGVGLQHVEADLDGTVLYGALGSWGALRPGPDGKLRPEPFVPADHPKWVFATNFTQIISTPAGVYFGGLNGIVFWDRKTGAHRFFEIGEVSRMFSHDGEIHVSSHGKGTFVVDTAAGELRPADKALFHPYVVAHFASGAAGTALLSTTYRSLYLLKDGTARLLPGISAETAPGSVHAMVQLPEGGFVVSIDGRGLFLLDAEGGVKTALTGPEFLRVSALGSNEPGVLWALGETGLTKILYGQPITSFGRTLGLPISWPQVVSWNGQLVVSTAGRLFRPVPQTNPGPTPFERMPGEPSIGAWGIAAVGSWLLLGNGDGVHARTPDTGFVTVASGFNAARVVAIDDSTCIAIGPDVIVALRVKDGVWTECAPRITGVGYPFVVHAGLNSAWIELAVNRAARVSLTDGKLVLRLFESFPWTRPQWVNVSFVGPIALLSGSDGRRLYFDERTETLTSSPDIDDILSLSPVPILRLCQDRQGNLWGSHERGVVRFSKSDGGYHMDPANGLGLHERNPIIRALPGDELWISTGQSLYHLDESRWPPPAPNCRPVLLTVRDTRDYSLVFHAARDREVPSLLPYARNSVAFDFFAGSYASKQPFGYQYRLNEGRWTPAVRSSVALTELPEGQYALTVQVVDARGPIGMPRSFRFAVLAPWYRRWYALASYPLLAGGALFGLLWWSTRRAQAQNAALEKLVAQRTRELESTMKKLENETRTSATLSERNRLAGEIHDSLEQSLTGLNLQLETTASFPNCPSEVKSGLALALNMVAYSRNEVRHVVRDLYSPLLDASDLGTALRRIVESLAPGDDYVTIEIEGTRRRLDSTVEHHLLRIAQEAIANAVKHSGATQVRVSLVYREAEVELIISDNGRGFDPDVVLTAGGGHFGLPSFRGRASKMGGTVKISSKPGAGTRIKVRVPASPTAIS